MAPDVEHLLPGVRRGDPAAFEALVRAMTPALYSYAAGMLRDPDAAEEIAQRTLIRVHRKRRRLDEGGTLRGFCYRIATNYALNHMRDMGLRRKREQEAAEMRKPEVTDPRSATPANEAWRLAEELPEVQRATLHLRYAQGLTIAETARALGVPEGTASTHQRKGLEALRKRLALTLAVVAPAVGLGQLMSAHQPAGTVASASTVSRIGAAVMASTATQAVSNTTVLAILALLLAAGGVTIAIVAWPQESPDVQVATSTPIEVQATESPQPVPEPDDESQPAQPEDASTTEPEPEVVEDQVEPEPTQDLDLLKQLRADYEAINREAFFETEEECNDAQPWDLEVLLPFFREVIDAKLRRWHLGYHEPSDINLERALFGLIVERLKSGASFGDVVHWFNDVADKHKLNETSNQKPRGNESHAKRNPDGDALGHVAVQLIRLRGFAKSQAFVDNIFGRTELEDAPRYARIQIAVCNGLGEDRVEEAGAALEELYLTPAYRPVASAAFGALIKIKGEKYIKQEAERLATMLQDMNTFSREAFYSGYIAIVSNSPHIDMALDAAERIFDEMQELGRIYLPDDITLRWAFLRRYEEQKRAGVDESKAILKRFDECESIGMVMALLRPIGEAYRGTNDPFAKRVLLDKAKGFEESGWTKDLVPHGFALSVLYGHYCGITQNVSECLSVLMHEWYPTKHQWALRSLDNALFKLANWATQDPNVGASSAKLIDLMFQRIEGKGEFGYDKRTHRLDSARKVLVALDRPEVRAALVDKVAEVEDEEVRKFYEETLAEWDKQNGE